MRVVSYNILAGGYRPDKENPRRTNEIVQIIRSAHPDVVGIIEAINPDKTERPSVIEEIAEQLGMQLIQAHSANPRDYSVALLTKLPIIHQQIHKHPDIHRSLLEVCVEETPGQHVTAFVTHLNAAFSSYRAGDSIRLREARQIVQIMSRVREQGQPHLLMGDFNSLAPGDAFTVSALLRYVVGLDIARKTPKAYDGNPYLDFIVPPRLRFLNPILRVIPQSNLLSGALDTVASLYDPRNTIRYIRNAGYVDCYRSLHPKARGFTCPAAMPAGRIDYIFADPMLAQRLENCYVINEGNGLPGKDASDHLAIAAEYTPVPTQHDAEISSSQSVYA